MNKFILRIIPMVMLLITVMFFAGCGSHEIYKTMALSERCPAVSTDSVQVFERETIVNRNYQLLGQVTVNGKFGIAKKTALSILQEETAKMGGDAIIDAHIGPGCAWRYDAGMHYSGLVVKWLKPGESPKPVDKPFVITRLPIMNPEKPNEPLVLKKVSLNLPVLDFPWINGVVFKGYYVLPDYKYHLSGVKGLQSKEKAALQKVGGKDSQLLLNVSSVVADSHLTVGAAVLDVGLFKEHESYLRVELFNKQSGDVILNNTGKGSFLRLWWMDMMMNKIESGAELSMGKAIKEALNDLPVVLN